MILWPLNDTIWLFSFFNLKQTDEIISLLCSIYHCTPPRNFSMYLYPGDKSMVNLWIIPALLPRKIIPWATSVSITILSNDTILTGFCEKLYSSYILVLLNPNSSPILSLGAKNITDLCGDISMMLPSVLKSVFI